MDLDQSKEHRKMQISKLKEWRDKVYHKTPIYKERSKRWNDIRLKPKFFNLGDKVLLFSSSVKLFYHEKLQNKWLGPYLVIDTSTHGAITTQDDDDNIHIHKVNGHCFKLFIDHNKALDEEIYRIHIVDHRYMLN